MSMPDDRTRDVIRCCPCCGLAQWSPVLSPGQRARCARCRTVIHAPTDRLRSGSRTAAIALAALILYPFAVTMPIMRLAQLGRTNESSILDGTATLLSEGHFWVGLIVLLCSVIMPLAKLAGLLALSTGRAVTSDRHRAWTYRFVEWTGRWGMLDVLAVAVLVSAVKLGSNIELSAGPGALAFASVVILSLLATASFDPHALWDDAPVAQTVDEAGAPRSAGGVAAGETTP